MSRRRKSQKAEKYQCDRVAKRLSNISDGPPPDYPTAINHRDHWKRITIESSDGTVDVIMLYMAFDRVNSWNLKDGDLLIMNDRKRPKRIGSNRAGVYIGTKLGCYGRHDEA